jgi:hypothetical protein
MTESKNTTSKKENTSTKRVSKTPIKAKTSAKKITSKADSVKNSVTSKAVDIKTTAAHETAKIKKSVSEKLPNSVATFDKPINHTSSKLLGTLLGLGLVVALLAGAGLYLHQQAKDLVGDHFADNDNRRAELINEVLGKRQESPTTVLTEWDFIRPVYSQVYTNPFVKEEALVEVNYLQLKGLKYEVRKSYRVLVKKQGAAPANETQAPSAKPKESVSLDYVKELASDYDLHLDTPQEELDQENLVLERSPDLDIPADEREGRKSQLVKQREDALKQLEEAKAFYAGLSEALDKGEKEYKGQPITPDVTKEGIQQTLKEIDSQLEIVKK